MKEHLDGKYLRDAQTGCWNWVRSKGKDGYGLVTVAGKLYRAPRLAFEAFVRPIPEGLHIDHLCRNRLCVNPAHLEPVTPKENVRRGAGFGGALRKIPTHCKRGHPLSGANLRVSEIGNDWKRLVCRTCVRDNMRKYRGRVS